ncbi:MAG: FHA domain-containing protein [Deltaproteobacteria bacterium]|nr:FHA domain-containing protein [Deltaproteobacteria bacterium]
MTDAATRTDVGAAEWSLDDGVARLRVWGTDHLIRLRPEALFGAAEECAVRLIDPSERVSRRHARLVRDGERWVLRDTGSKNGLLFDGVRRAEGALEPGVEIGIGGLTLVVESPRLIALRAFFARILGWSSVRIADVDLALRAVRAAAMQRVPLVLCGEEDLVPLARGIHRRALGPERPFTLCDPRRRTVAANVRKVENHGRGLDALAAAQGGSLCVWSRHLPGDFDEVRRRARHPGSRVHLFVCAHHAADASLFAAAPIVVPPLASRASRPGELGRIIDEYGADAAAELGARHRFTAFDRAWVAERAPGSLAELEKATLRLVALREGGNVARAAAMLGMSGAALTEWIERRRLRRDGA